MALSVDFLKKLPAGASSLEALERATGGRVEGMGKRLERNVAVLNIDGRRFIYVRPQALRQARKTAYGTSGLRSWLGADTVFPERDLDHVASTDVEGGRIGMSYCLVAMVKKSANRSHGSTNESGPAPVREAAVAFSGGLDRKGEHHVSYLTQQMVDKLAGNLSAGRGRSTFTREPSVGELHEISRALLQDQATQARLKQVALIRPTL